MPGTPACRAFSDDAQGASKAPRSQPSPEFGAVATATDLLRVEKGQMGFERALSNMEDIVLSVITGPDGVEKFFGGLFGELIEAHGEGNLLFGTANGKDANGADQPWAGLATHVFESRQMAA
jgi:hypothetical protein